MKISFRYKYIFLIILLLSILFHWKYINDFPAHTHAWAQCDRYAIAQGFTNNGLNLFKPETFIHNPEFPHKWNTPGQTTITAVDLPIHEYIIGIFMKLTGSKSPWIFRSYILIYSCIGLYFLYMFCLLLTRSHLKSIFSVLVFFTSPAFIFYQGGFLPTAPALANTFIAIYYYTLFLKTQKNRHFNKSIIFQCIAALNRTTFVIPLVAILSVEFIRGIRGKSKLKPKILPVALSVTSILGYLFYNMHLREMYGSIFLSSLRPAKSWEEVKLYLSKAIENWKYEYFSPIHYWIILTTLVTALVLILLHKQKKLDKPLAPVISIVALMSVGYILFAIAMLKKFQNHDYYFLDSIFIPLILLFVISISLIPIDEKLVFRRIFLVVSASCCVYFTHYGLYMQDFRREVGYWDSVYRSKINYTGASHFLDSLGIPKNAKILAIDTYAPNLPFLLMDRKGFAIMKPSRKVLENALNWNFDYITIQNDLFVKAVYPEYPDIINRIERIADNGKISICRLRDDSSSVNLDEFLGLSKKTPVFHTKLDFESKTDSNWKYVKYSDKHARSGMYSGKLDQNTEIAFRYDKWNLECLKDEPRVLKIEAYLMSEKNGQCDITASIYANRKPVAFDRFNVKPLLEDNPELHWKKIEFIVNLPKVNSGDFEFSVYLFNVENAELLIDDFKISIY